MDHQLNFVVELEPDDFQEITRGVWANPKHLWRVCLWFEVDDSECIAYRMENRVLVVSVPMRRAVEFHSSLTYYEILAGRPAITQPRRCGMLCAHLAAGGARTMADPTAVRNTVIEANGLRFTADMAGPAEGPAVLLLHGFPQTRHTWRTELTALAAAGYRACAPDQRGYSAGARPDSIDNYRVEMLVADALGIADSLDADRFHIVGHDWGGALAWFIAAHLPERITSLSVISRPHPAAFMAAMRDDPDQPHRSRHHPAFQRPEATDALLVDNAGALRRAMARCAVSEADIDAYLGTLSDRDALDAAVNWYRAMGQSSIQSADTPAISVPTMFVWGNEDATVGRMAAENTAEFVTGPYRFAELPGVNHFVTDEAPGVFTELLLTHLAEHG